MYNFYKSMSLSYDSNTMQTTFSGITTILLNSANGTHQDVYGLGYDSNFGWGMIRTTAHTADTTNSTGFDPSSSTIFFNDTTIQLTNMRYSALNPENPVNDPNSTNLVKTQGWFWIPTDGSIIFNTSIPNNTVLNGTLTLSNGSVSFSGTITPINPYVAPCFSYNTLNKILSTLPKNKIILVTKTKRNNKKMYKINYGLLGELEFTDDHPFLYNNKLYQMKDLINVHPYFKKHAEIKNNIQDEYIYNIYGHYQQQHKDNQFEIGPNLQMLGGRITDNKEDYDKVKAKMEEIKEEIKTKPETKEKYSLTKFLESSIDSCELHMVIV